MFSRQYWNWESLSSAEFEDLCADLLGAMQFENVEQRGSTGDKGRDILCRKDLRLAPGLTRPTTWIVQCKRTKKIAKADLLNDLASVVEHTCDFWLLMTSAKISPSLADWLGTVGRKEYPFGVDFIDCSTLDRLLLYYPNVAVIYFPSSIDRVDRIMASAMDVMNLSSYPSALKILKDVQTEGHPRVHHLRACCYSRLASASRANRSKYVKNGFAELEEASRLGYVKYISERFGWPETKCLFEISRDPELQFLKGYDVQRFHRSFPEQKGSVGGGCFSAETKVKILGSSEIPIEKVNVGNAVLGLDAKGNKCYVKVLAKHQLPATVIVHVNEHISCSLYQPLLTERGWSVAGNLRLGQAVSTDAGGVLVRHLHFAATEQLVYGITVEGTGCFYAEGYLAHNKLPY